MARTTMIKGLKGNIVKVQNGYFVFSKYGDPINEYFAKFVPLLKGILDGPLRFHVDTNSGIKS